MSSKAPQYRLTALAKAATAKRETTRDKTTNAKPKTQATAQDLPALDRHRSKPQKGERPPPEVHPKLRVAKASLIKREQGESDRKEGQDARPVPKLSVAQVPAVGKAKPSQESAVAKDIKSEEPQAGSAGGKSDGGRGNEQKPVRKPAAQSEQPQRRGRYDSSSDSSDSNDSDDSDQDTPMPRRKKTSVIMPPDVFVTFKCSVPGCTESICTVNFAGCATDCKDGDETTQDFLAVVPNPSEARRQCNTYYNQLQHHIMSDHHNDILPDERLCMQRARVEGRWTIKNMLDVRDRRNPAVEPFLQRTQNNEAARRGYMKNKAHDAQLRLEAAQEVTAVTALSPLNRNPLSGVAARLYLQPNTPTTDPTEAAQHYQARTDELFSALTQAAAAATQLSNDEHGCRSHLELMGINPDSAAEHMAQYRTVLEHIKQVPEFPRESIKERDRMIGKRARKARKERKADKKRKIKDEEGQSKDQGEIKGDSAE